MNGLFNKSVLRRCNLKLKTSSIYSLVFKSKFRRHGQPGLTRYNNDEYDHQNGNMDVCKYLFKLKNIKIKILIIFSFFYTLVLQTFSQI